MRQVCAMADRAPEVTGRGAPAGADQAGNGNGAGTGRPV